MDSQVYLLYLITGIGQYTLDSYLPSLPKLASLLSVTPQLMQYTIGIFLIAMALSQPVYGFLSDLFGRKKILLIGLFILFLGTVTCMLSNSYLFFISGRILQGVGIGATSSLCKSIARDIYTGERLKKYMSTMIIVWGISLIAAPFLGGILMSYFGWKSVFISQLVLALLCCILSIYQKETLRLKSSFLSFRQMQYQSPLIKNSRFIFNTFICAVCTSVIYGINM